MGAQAELLDAAKSALGLTSDNSLAVRIEATRAAVGNWRSGERNMSDEFVVTICELARLDAGYWLLRVNEEHADGAVRAVWRGLRQAIGKVAGVALTTALLAALAQSGAVSAVQTAEANAPSLYIMSSAALLAVALMRAVRRRFRPAR